MYKIATLASGAKPVSVPEKGYTADVDAILARVTPRTKIVFLANPNNPTGTYLPNERGAPPAQGAARQRAARDRRGLLRVRAPQRLRGGAGAGRHHRQHGDDAHLLQDLRARRAAGSAGPIARRRWPTRSTARAGPSTSMRRRSPPAWRRSPTARTWRPAIAHNEKWLPWVTAEIEKLGLEVTPSVGNFVLIHFADAEGAGRRRGRRVPQGARHHPAPRRPPTACPTACA